ncbi:MAG: PEGA domain-containing protein [Pirellulales bacterium]|nr:PEGA domain-containing protein [Pirellulales bacterium]
MKAVLLCLVMAVSVSAATVETSDTPKTRIYVRTVPQNAQIIVDGKELGKSDGLFLVPPGVRKVTIEMDGYDPKTDRIDVKEGWITRVEVVLVKSKGPNKTGDSGKERPLVGLDDIRLIGRDGLYFDIPQVKDKTLGVFVAAYDNGTAEGYRSLGGSGHAIQFKLEPPGVSKHFDVVGIDIFASRYGDPEPPKEDFHVYLLDEKNHVIKDVPWPYSKIKRTGDLKWCHIDVPPTRVPDRFSVALSFNPHQTKGIYLGYDKDVSQSHSYTGLPDRGFTAVPEKYDWMVRVHLAPKMRGPQDSLTHWLYEVITLKNKDSSARKATPSRWKSLPSPTTEVPDASDPFSTSPPDAKVHKEGRQILKRMIEVNRYWLLEPPKTVKSYAFLYLLGNDQPKTYKVPDAAKARSALRQGTTYYSPLHVLAEDPDSVTFTLIQRENETIRLDYVLEEPIDSAYGNGLEGHWIGYFQRNVGRGTLILDAKRFTLQIHRMQGVEERFSDFVLLDTEPALYARGKTGHFTGTLRRSALRESGAREAGELEVGAERRSAFSSGAAYVPQRIKIHSDGLGFDWHFTVHPPGLWILDKGRSIVGQDDVGQTPDQASLRAVTLKVLRINGEKLVNRESKGDNKEETKGSEAESSDIRAPQSPASLQPNIIPAF